MKRKQFHLSPIEEEILHRIGKDTGQSEAEIVREAIKEYWKNRMTDVNPLLEMAKAAQEDTNGTVSDLSTNHDKYLVEIFANEE